VVSQADRAEYTFGMNAMHRICPAAAGVWSLLIATGVVLADPASRRAGGSCDRSVQTLGVVMAHPAIPVAMARCDVPAPTCGDDAYRPSHFTVASVSVTCHFVRCICLSRIGGLYGP